MTETNLTDLIDTVSQENDSTQLVTDTPSNKIVTNHIPLGSNAKVSKLNFLYTNADSLSNKISELEAIAEIGEQHVLCITETLPKNCINRSEYINIELNGYEGYHTNTGRGVSIYIKENIRCEKVEIQSDFNDSLWVKIYQKNGCSLIVGCIYRSPNSEVINNENLLKLLQKAADICATNRIIVGDFNYKEIDWVNNVVHASNSHPAAKMYDKINDLFWNQLVTNPTRFREGENENLLDWVLTDNGDIIDELGLNPPLGEKGDHCVINFKVECALESTRHGDQRNYYRADYDSIRSALQTIHWETRLESKSVDEAWGEFLSIIEGLLEKHIPLKRNKKRKSQPWINLEVKSEIRAKNKAWKEYKKDKSIEKWEIFKIIRNNTNRKVQQHKCEFERKIAHEISSNPKQFWSYVKSKNKVSNSYPDLINTNGDKVTGDGEKANCFNRYFASVYTDENTNEIPVLSERSGVGILNSVEITQEIVESHLNKINTSKAAGPDNLHAKVLSELKYQISLPLSIIFSRSLSESKIPQDWKLANIKPLHKKGSKNLVSNYRPVSLTAICGKLMEKIIRNAIIKYMEDHNLLSKDQHGFRTGRSCVTQLLEIMELWTKFMENGLTVDCVYLDYAKAFDKVPHLRLINKLKAYGISGNMIEWIKNFLTNRNQKVVINGTSSEIELVKSGIPQGSVLGPTLFIIFINDLPDEIKTYIKIFADDTKIFNAIKTSQDSNILQEDIDNLALWTIKWQLPLNMDKSKVIHYGRNNTEKDYHITDIGITKDEVEKDLGVNFDSKLKFSPHVATIAKKANSRLGLIKRNFANKSKDIIIPLYKSLVRPILEYASCIWNPTLRRDVIEIEKVQRRATKLISTVSHLPYEDRLKMLKLDSLAFRRRRCDMLQVYRIVHKIDKIELTDFFELNTLTNTRGHSLKFKKPRVNTSQRLSSFALRVINDWNQLKEETVTSPTINTFKTRLADEWKNHPERFFEQ